MDGQSLGVFGRATLGSRGINHISPMKSIAPYKAQSIGVPSANMPEPERVASLPSSLARVALFEFSKSAVRVAASLLSLAHDVRGPEG